MNTQDRLNELAKLIEKRDRLKEFCIILRWPYYGVSKGMFNFN